MIEKRLSAKVQPWLYLAPALIGLVIFQVYPLIHATYLSFFKGALITQVFSGFTNYQVVLGDHLFRLAVTNTFLYAIIVTPIALILSLFVATMLIQKFKRATLLEALFFLPYVTSTIAIGAFFRVFFNSENGLLNQLLAVFKLAPVRWLDDVHLSLFVLIIFGIWQTLAFDIIILTTSLRKFERTHYQVATLAGATSWETFRYVTLPRIMPVLTFLFVVNSLNSLKVYAQVYVLFNGQAGVASSAMTVVYYVYQKFYIDNLPGQAMAAIVLFFLASLLLIIGGRLIVKKVVTKL
jgi:multiple sugar transport system permease protein